MPRTTTPLTPLLFAALVLTMSLFACVGGAGPEDMSSTSDPTAEPASEPATAPAAADWTDQWWYKTYGDDAVLAADSTVGVVLNRTEQRDDDSVSWTAQATFRSQEGAATLETLAGRPEGKKEETVELTAEEYSKLWKDVIATGWVADAMAGEGGEGFGSGTEVYLTGAAGPDGLGWTVSATREAFEGFPSTARVLELLMNEATSRSPVFAEGVELVEEQ